MPEAQMIDPSAEPPDPIAKGDEAMYDRQSERLGGTAANDAVLTWAEHNLTPAEAQAYNRRLADPNQVDAATDELVGRYVASGAVPGYASLDEFNKAAHAAAQNDSAAALHARRTLATPNEVLQIGS